MTDNTRIMIKITRSLHEKLKLEHEETKVPMIFLLEKAWREYEKTKEEITIKD